MIQVQAPNGDIVQFPDGTPDDVMASAMRKAYGGRQIANHSAKSGQDSFSGAAIAKDMGRQSIQGVKNAVTGLVGLPGDIANLAGDASAGWAGILGASPQGAEVAQRIGAKIAGNVLNPASIIYGQPSTQADLNAVASKFMGPDVAAQTWQGRLAGNTAEMAAGAIGPGGLVRKGAQVVLPGVASFAAGEATEGTSLQPWAKGAAALGGGLASGIGAERQAVNAVLKQAPLKTQKQAARATNTLYKELRDAGASYDPAEFGAMAGRLGQKLVEEGIMETDAPKTWKRINMILEGAQAGRSPSWTELNSMRKGLGRLMRGADGEERAAAAIVFDDLAKLEKTAPITSAAGISQDDLVAKAAQARDFGLRNIKAKEFAKREGNATSYIEGIESGLRRQTGNMLRSKYGNRLFTNPDERKALEDVTAGSTARKSLAAFGKLGFDPTRLGNMNSVIPAIGLAASGGYGASTGDWENAGKAVGLMGLASLSKMGARKLTERDARRAMEIILAGPKAQRDMVLAYKGATRDALLRRILAVHDAALAARE